MILPSHRPLCIILSAPSGTGKTTLCNRLLREFPAMVYSISCTTRAPRKGEVDGKNYYFLTEAEFERRVKSGFFLEYAQVHGNWYGTPKQRIEQALIEGHDVLLAIDVQGAERIRTLIAGPAPDIIRQAFVDIFIVPPSSNALKQRLEGRGQDTEATISRRLKNAEQEMTYWQEYQYLIVNDRLNEAYDRLCSIVKAEHCRVV